MTTYKIYLITNRLNGVKYVGKTTSSLRTRFSQHFRPPIYLFQSEIRKAGKGNCSIELLEETPNKALAATLERQYIERLNTLYPHGYNLKAGSPSDKWTDFVKNKISAGNKGKVRTQQMRDHLRSVKAKKQVRCLTTGVVYESKAACCRDLKINKGHLSMYFNGRASSVKGHMFQLLEGTV